MRKFFTIPNHYPYVIFKSITLLRLSLISKAPQENSLVSCFIFFFCLDVIKQYRNSIVNTDEYLYLFETIIIIEGVNAIIWYVDFKL